MEKTKDVHDTGENKVPRITNRIERVTLETEGTLRLRSCEFYTGRSEVGRNALQLIVRLNLKDEKLTTLKFGKLIRTITLTRVEV